MNPKGPLFMSCPRTLIVALILAGTPWSTAARGEILWETTLREPLGHRWTGELLRYRVQTARPIPDDCFLVAGGQSGETRPIPCQIGSRSVDKDTNAHVCELYCLVDLEPYQTLKLQLMPGKPPAEASGELPVGVAGLQSEISNLKSQTPNIRSHLISSLKLEILVPASIEDAFALSEPQIPAPLLGIRNVEQNCWIGAGRFTNVGKLTSLETKAVVQGAVFTDVSLDCRFAKGRYSVVLRVIRDQPVVLWTEKFQHADPSAALVWECSAGMPLVTGVWDYGEWSAFKNRVVGGGLGASRAFPLEFDSAPAPFTFQPWVRWASTDVTSWLELWSVLPKIGKVDYKGAGIGEGQALAEAKETGGKDDLVAGGDDIEAAEAGEKPPAKEWAVGIFMGKPLDWNPQDGGAYWSSSPRLELTKEKQVLLRLPIHRGQRTFGLSLAERTPDKRIGNNLAVGVPDTEARQIKYGETPLDDVKDYVLDYGEDLQNCFPRLLITEERRAKYAASLSKEMPFYAEIMRSLENWRAQAQKEFRKLAAEAPGWSLADTTPGWKSGDQDIIRVALAAPDDSLAPLLQVAALSASSRFATHFFRHGTGPSMGIAPHNWLSEEYGFSIVDIASRRLSDEQFRRVRARMLFAAYKFSSENFWSPRLGFAANPNMTTIVNGALGAIAMLYPNHPKAKDWRSAVEREVNHELTNWMCPDGGWLEAPHYMTVAMDPIIGFGYALANAGNPEILYGDRLKKTMLWLAKISTPRDPRFGNRRHFPEIGNTYVMETSVLFTLMARVQRERDPAYADGMQWLWYEMGCPTWPGIGGAYPLTAGYREALADAAPKPATPPNWKSELFRGSGAVLRAHFPCDRESYLYLIQGPMHAHYDDDLGSFMMWGKGRPLCLDWGYKGCMPAWMHNRMDIGGGGKIEEFAALDSADYLHNVQSAWHRQILFVKDADPLGPNYFLVRDSTSGDGDANWRLWLNTDDHPLVEGQMVCVRGRDDVDMELWFDEPSSRLLKRIRKPIEEKTPASAEVSLSAPKPKDDEEKDDPMREALTQEEQEKRPLVAETAEVTVPCVIGPGGRFWGKADGTTQRGIHLTVPKGQPVVALLYPRLHAEQKPKVSPFADGRALKIESPSGVDYVFLGLEPFEAAIDSIRFKGRAGAVQVRDKTVTLSLPVAGEVASGKDTLQSDKPAVRRSATRE
jgi:hypothetical protein